MNMDTTITLYASNPHDNEFDADKELRRIRIGWHLDAVSFSEVFDLLADNPPSWHSIVHFGTYGPVDRIPPHGPYRSRELAEAALGRFIRRLGHHGGSYLAATSIRVVGPFPTRAVARDANISNYPTLITSRRD